MNTVIIMQVSFQIGLNRYCQLETLAIVKKYLVVKIVHKNMEWLEIIHYSKWFIITQLAQNISIGTKWFKNTSESFKIVQIFF